MIICIDYNDGHPDFYRNVSFKASVNKEYGPNITIMGDYPISFDITLESLQMLSFLNDEGILSKMHILVIHTDTGDIDVWE